MSRKVTKSILSRDEISLLKNSDEPKNTILYGNLYDILNSIYNVKAISIEFLIEIGLNKNGQLALTQNRNALFDNVKREWYVENQSAEDPSKKVRCGLCNTPNKYLFYIRNRLNNKKLNVGSFCMTKFPGIEGYTNHKYQLEKIKRTQNETKRILLFNEKCQNAELIIDSANFYFDNLPILVPFEIYDSLEKTVNALYSIYHKYVKGRREDENQNPFEIFTSYVNDYNRLKKLADIFIANNINEKLICHRKELDWLLSKNKKNIIEEISRNNGFYSKETLKQIISIDFIANNFNIFTNSNKCKNIKLIYPQDTYSDLSCVIEDEGYNFTYEINIKKFMFYIGSECIFDNEYTFTDKDIFKISKMKLIYSNVNNILEIVQFACKNTGYVLLIDYNTNDLYLYHKGNKSIKSFSQKEMIKLYDSQKIKKKIRAINFIGILITYKKWITIEQQYALNIDEKINKLYYNQYIKPYL